MLLIKINTVSIESGLINPSPLSYFFLETVFSNIKKKWWKCIPISMKRTSYLTIFILKTTNSSFCCIRSSSSRSSSMKRRKRCWRNRSSLKKCWFMKWIICMWIASDLNKMSTVSTNWNILVIWSSDKQITTKTIDSNLCILVYNL